MYETIFQLNDRPFLATPQTRCYFAAEPIENARQTLIRGIQRAEGPGLLIGPPGSGKSLVCQMLAEQFAEEFDVVMLSSTRLCTPRALLQNILFELGLPFRELEEGELRLNLIDFLQRGDQCLNGILLLVDEANTLPLRLLEEIRMITNVVRDGTPRVRLVLAGGPQLEERFTSPRLESLNQRVAARCYLQSMTREETADYVKHQIRLAGGDSEALFRDDALQAVFHATDGIPRLVNQVCDHGLMLAAAAGDHCLTASNIEESWADLQQLPAPSMCLEPAAPSGSGDQCDIIEFGQLDDEDSESEPAEHETVGEIDQDHAVESDAEETHAESLDTSTLVEPPPTIEMPVVDTLQSTWADNEDDAVEPRDPFGADFDEEEVVLDRYASLDANSADVTRQGTAAEVAVHAENSCHAGEDNDDEQMHAGGDAHSDHQAEEPAVVEVFAEEAHIVADAGEIVDGEVPDDDRDLIVIEEDAAEDSSVPQPASARAKRREYKHLFAKLRQQE